MILKLLKYPYKKQIIRTHYEKAKKTTKIRENITEVDYQKLLVYLNGKVNLTSNTKNNLKRTFVLLYFTGMRINEVKQLKVKNINTIFEKKELWRGNINSYLEFKSI